MTDIILCSWPTCPRYIEGFDRLCPAHKTRAYWGKDMDEPLMFRSRETTLLGKLLERSRLTDSGCLEWTGARMPSGHGQVQGEDGRLVLTHRAMYEIKVGPIPDGMVLDHLCENPPCMNPQHLDPVTHRENTHRHRLRNRPDTCVKCGADDWIPNPRPSGTISRRCRPCTNRTSAEGKRRRKQQRRQP